MVSTREEFSPRGRTNRTNKEAIESCTLFSQGINIGGRQVGVSMKAKVAPPLIIGQEDNHIGFRP
jgi:hypothetical protein